MSTLTMPVALYTRYRFRYINSGFGLLDGFCMAGIQYVAADEHIVGNMIRIFTPDLMVLATSVMLWRFTLQYYKRNKPDAPPKISAWWKYCGLVSSTKNMYHPKRAHCYSFFHLDVRIPCWGQRAFGSWFPSPCRIRILPAWMEYQRRWPNV